MPERHERIVVVRNPVSTRTDSVETHVVSRLRETVPPSHVAEIWTPSGDHDEITEHVAESIQPGDTVVVAAGDGTGNAVANAYMYSHDSDGVRLAFLPYGNFNDMARTFTDKDAQRDPSLLLDASATTVSALPLEVLANEEHYRYAVLYATLGWSAVAASLFAQPETRRNLHQGRMGVGSSLVTAAKMYFATRRDSALSPFSIDNDERIHSAATDIAAVNGPVMAHLIRTNRSYYETGTFLTNTLDLSTLTRNARLVGSVGLNFAMGTRLVVPGDIVDGREFHFDNATLPIQIDGEFDELKDVGVLTVRKNASEGAKRIDIIKTT